jgi:predicted alpha/beta-fold hydrolase
MEIIYGNTLDQRHQINYDREIVNTPDGENLALDWDDPQLLKTSSDSSPIVIFLPGLTGNSTSPYIRKCIFEMRKSGMRSLVFNPRGSIIPQKTVNLFNFENIYDDLDFVLSHVERKYPNSNIYFVGFSLGSSYGMRFLADHQSRIKGMVSIANPFDVFEAAKSLNSAKHSIYS